MDNAGRRNIHALAACGETGMDCQAPSPDEDDRNGLSKIVGGSGSEILRRVPPKLSRIGMQRPAFPHDAPSARGVSHLRPGIRDGGPSLSAVLDDLHQTTSRRVRTLVRAGTASFFLMVAGPYEAVWSRVDETVAELRSRRAEE